MKLMHADLPGVTCLDAPSGKSKEWTEILRVPPQHKPEEKIISLTIPRSLPTQTLSRSLSISLTQ